MNGKCDECEQGKAVILLGATWRRTTSWRARPLLGTNARARGSRSARKGRDGQVPACAECA
jgi:hypothetical protein